MPLRVCSILGTLLLALALTSPAFAEGDQGDEGSSADSDKGGSETAPDMSNETPSEPDTWEHPPAEKEKPVAPPPKPVEKPLGSDRPWSAALLLGYGFKTDRQTGGFGSDPYGLAAELRGGYSLDFHLYLGLFFSYYLGSSRSGTSAQLNTGVKNTTASYMQFGAEVGYDVWAGPVVLRPSLELGPAIAFSDASGATRSVTDMMFGPGITVFHPWEQFFLGGDGRFVLASSDGVSAFLLALTGGMRFE